MRITKYGHACMLIEETGSRILIDPGEFSRGFEAPGGIDAVLITHHHRDHMSPMNLEQLFAKNPKLAIFADEASAAILYKQGLPVEARKAGDSFRVGEVEVTVWGRDHAVIHSSIPVISDVGYMIARRFFYPGDAFTVPSHPVEILAAPVAAPWLKIGEAVDYVREIKPSIVIPVHDAVLSEAGRQIHFGALTELTKDLGVEARVIENGSSWEG